tara:strand:+ start:88 stop:3909 length:3822 start_codon:yes stop_codon:yes gene_type:complete
MSDIKALSRSINNWDSRWNTQLNFINKELLKENQPKYFGLYLLDDLKLANYLKKDGTVNTDNPIFQVLENRGGPGDGGGSGAAYPGLAPKLKKFGSGGFKTVYAIIKESLSDPILSQEAQHFVVKVEPFKGGSADRPGAGSFLKVGKAKKSITWKLASSLPAVFKDEPTTKEVKNTITKVKDKGLTGIFSVMEPVVERTTIMTNTETNKKTRCCIVSANGFLIEAFLCTINDIHYKTGLLPLVLQTPATLVLQNETDCDFFKSTTNRMKCPLPGWKKDNDKIYSGDPNDMINLKNTIQKAIPNSAIVTVQEKLAGDYANNCHDLYKNVPLVFNQDSYISVKGPTSKEFLSHLIHIGFNLSIFQSKYGFMHNDMHAMNIYLLDTDNILPNGEGRLFREKIKPPAMGGQKYERKNFKDLLYINYKFKSSMKGNPIRHLSIRRQSRALPVLADFGQSEFHIDGSFIENELIKDTRPTTHSDNYFLWWVDIIHYLSGIVLWLNDPEALIAGKKSIYKYDEGNITIDKLKKILAPIDTEREYDIKTDLLNFQNLLRHRQVQIYCIFLISHIGNECCDTVNRQAKNPYLGEPGILLKHWLTKWREQYGLSDGQDNKTIKIYINKGIHNLFGYKNFETWLSKFPEGHSSKHTPGGKLHNQAGDKIRALRCHNLNISLRHIKYPHRLTRKGNITLPQTKVIVDSFMFNKDNWSGNTITPWLENLPSLISNLCITEFTNRGQNNIYPTLIGSKEIINPLSPQTIATLSVPPNYPYPYVGNDVFFETFFRDYGGTDEFGRSLTGIGKTGAAELEAAALQRKKMIINVDCSDYYRNKMYIQRDDLYQTKDNPKNNIEFLEDPAKEHLTISGFGSTIINPTRIIPIDINIDGSSPNVVLYQFHNIVDIPPLSIIETSGGNRKFYRDGADKNDLPAISNKKYPQNINVILIKKPISDDTNLKTDLFVGRKRLSDILKGITNTGPNVNPDFNPDFKKRGGVILSGGFFKLWEFGKDETGNIDPKSRSINCALLKHQEAKDKLKCFKSIGPVIKDKQIVNTNPIPHTYSDVYGYVSIGNNNEIKINTPKDVNTQNYDDLLSAGPMLLQPTQGGGTKILFGPDVKSKVIGANGKIENKKFKDQNRFLGKRQKLSKGPFINCMRAESVGQSDEVCEAYQDEAGEFKHAFQQNPRTAVGTDIEGNIYFVTVEGRNVRPNSTGVDIGILAKIMKGLGCNSAINLDGGGTSNMMYKMPNSECYVNTNPYHKFNYPMASLQNTTSLHITFNQKT